MSEFSGIKQPNKVILMKVTSRERAEQLLETVRQYLEFASNPKDMVWLFTFDEDDQTCRSHEFHQKLLELIEPTGQGEKCLSVYGKSENKIHAINRDIDNEFFKSDWDILLNISDDQRPILKGYDSIIRRAMPDNLDASLWFSDGQPRINTQEIIGRNYYNRFGYIYHPDFKSLWCDNLSTDIALFQGKCIRSSQQIIKHYHPAWGGAQAFKTDALYERNNKFWNEDQATYERLKREGIDKLIK